MFYSGSVVFAQFSSVERRLHATRAASPTSRLCPTRGTRSPATPTTRGRRPIAISTIEAAYPTVGRLYSLRITSRTGLGDEGGRVLGITVKGAKGSVATTGSSFATKVGLKHHWFTPQVPASVTVLPARRHR